MRRPQKGMNLSPGPNGDERFTPRAMIEHLHLEHRFTVDAAGHVAAPSARIIGRCWTKRDDGLIQSWRGERVWVNPPFSQIPAWVKKAQSACEDGCPLVVMLLPATRTEQPFWHRHVEPIRDGGYLHSASGVKVKLWCRFLKGRARFGSPEDPEGVHSGSPTFGCVLLKWSEI